MLVVLDDALDAAQVRSLIPGSGGSRLIITSRNHLADPGVHPVQQPLMSHRRRLG
ncbi:hypothetical protein [Streptomyces violaceusniger]|uniref:hypothetical protein n=1 Tax=Streptomyces violaceusniger TaxID=68280 RepID=UPI0013969236|nr:hypothetical protein [Streptomyces hygroscopicus]